LFLSIKQGIRGAVHIRGEKIFWMRILPKKGDPSGPNRSLKPQPKTLQREPVFVGPFGCSLQGCRVDVSPTENSWMLRPLNKASLGYCVPDRCVPTLDRVKHGTSPVGHYRGLGRPPAPNESVGHLAGFAYAPDQVYWIGAPPSDACSAHT
jgi:hypothetical protein